MKKGFTIVELLAVISLLAVIAGIATTSAIGVSKQVKKNMYCEKVDMILQNAKDWGNKNLKKLNSSCYIEKTVTDLINEGYIKKEENDSGNAITNPYSNMPMDDMKIRIYLKNHRAAAWYIETEEALMDVCEAQEVERPTTSCS